MKKYLSLILAALMCMTMFVACAPAAVDENASGANLEDNATVPENDAEVPAVDEEPADDAEPAASDLQEIKDKGVLVVGITDFAPMDYEDENGEWIGFDADMAKAFAEYLGVDVEFQIIDWDNKVMELNSKTIDVVWNGMTLTDEVKAAMECSNAYCNNAQVVILPADVAENYADAESMKDLLFAVEAGSAGEAEATNAGFKTVAVTDQATALLEVKSGSADAAVIDSLMAGAMVGEGTNYAELTYTIGLNSEEYGVGFRKGSDVAAELNKFFAESYADGSMMATADIYGVEAAVIPQA